MKAIINRTAIPDAPALVIPLPPSKGDFEAEPGRKLFIKRTACKSSMRTLFL
jgi:hypothetical protein